jgi:ABC-type sugar transport system substrate-binding protein
MNRDTPARTGRHVRLRRMGLTVIAMSLLASMAACSSSGATSGTTTSTGSTSAGGSGGVAAARTVLAAATNGVVSAASINAPLAAVTTFNGPTTSSKNPGRLKIGLISSCQDPCAYVDGLVGALAQQHGATFTSEVGQTPQDWQQLMTNAINAHDNVIVLGGVPDAAVTQQTAAAKAAGIKTIGIAVERSVASGQGYDAYVSVRQDITYRLMLQAAIADSQGHAHVALFEPSGYATTDRYVADARSEFTKACPACSIIVQRAPGPTMADPTSLDSLVTATLNANPNVDYLLFGDDFYGFTGAQQAAFRLNRKVTMIAQDGSTPGLAAVKSGLVKYDAGAALEWIAYAAYDAIRRMVGGQASLPAPNAWGGGAHLWTAANLPTALTNEAATNMWRSFVHYPTAYKTLWAKAS